MARKPPTAMEREVLDVVLIELRHAMRKRKPIQITIDPWSRVHGAGCEIFAGICEDGHSYTVEPKR